nr:MAG: DUF4268 domain-containing protein [Chloroflexota bacterium]
MFGAPRITDEHRAALDWLNEVTDERINFFGLEIELWRIGDSPIAPKFNIVSQPNDWVRTLSASRQSTAGELTPTKQMQLEYWTAFKVYLEEHGSFLKSQKPFPQHWSNFAIGRSGFYLSAQMNTRDSVLNVSLIIDGRDAKAQFRALQAQKAEIEAEIGQPLTWRELPGKKSSDISLYLKDVDPNNRAQWPEQHAWLRQTLEAFHHAFAPRVRNLVVEAMAEENDTA